MRISKSSRQFYSVQWSLPAAAQGVGYSKEQRLRNRNYFSKSLCEAGE